MPGLRRSIVQESPSNEADEYGPEGTSLRISILSEMHIVLLGKPKVISPSYKSEKRSFL